jgi:hypothetical protein
MNASESILESPRKSSFWTETCSRIIAVTGNIYCRAFHKTISRPVNGKYRCWRCLREFDLGW